MRASFKLTCLTLALTIAGKIVSADSSGSDADDDFLKACLTSLGPDVDASDVVNDARAALEAGANINVKNERSGQTCLMGATLRGNAELVRFLLKEGADKTIAERDGYTPPHGAGFQGRPDIMRILKEEGDMDVLNEPHKDGFLPFHRACWGGRPGHTETVEYLLSLDFDVNTRGGEGVDKTCLEMTKNPDTIAVLKKYGAKESGGSDL